MHRRLEVMGSNEESLDVGRDRRYPGKEAIHLLVAHLGMHVVLEADLFERVEWVSSIGTNGLLRNNGSPDHLQMIERLCIVGDFHPGESRIAEPIRADHKTDRLRFFGSATAPTFDLPAAKEGIVHLDETGQLIAAIPMGHRAADLVAHRPDGLVGTDAQESLCFEHGDAVFVVAHEQDQPEPLPQRGPGFVEDGSGRQRDLVAAGSALVNVSGFDSADVPRSAAAAVDSFGPAVFLQILAAGQLG